MYQVSWLRVILTVLLTTLPIIDSSPVTLPPLAATSPHYSNTHLPTSSTKPYSSDATTSAASRSRCAGTHETTTTGGAPRWLWPCSNDDLRTEINDLQRYNMTTVDGLLEAMHAKLAMTNRTAKEIYDKADKISDAVVSHDLIWFAYEDIRYIINCALKY